MQRTTYLKYSSLGDVRVRLVKLADNSVGVGPVYVGSLAFMPEKTYDVRLPTKLPFPENMHVAL